MSLRDLVVREPLECGDHVGEHIGIEARVDLGGPCEQDDAAEPTGDGPRPAVPLRADLLLELAAEFFPGKGRSPPAGPRQQHRFRWPSRTMGSPVCYRVI
jgi:hypothetical protein